MVFTLIRFHHHFYIKLICVVILCVFWFCLNIDFFLFCSETITTWPVKHAAIVEGDVILGGLMMVHSREDTITCGPIMPQGMLKNNNKRHLFTIEI